MATARKFSNSILKHLKTAHAENAFTPTFVNGHWREPRFSLRRQAAIRKACLLNDIDPKSIAMPEHKERKIMQKKPPKGHKRQRLYAAKQAAIQKKMDDMPETIRKWKEEKEKEKEKVQSSLPF